MFIYHVLDYFVYSSDLHSPSTSAEAEKRKPSRQRDEQTKELEEMAESINRGLEQLDAAHPIFSQLKRSSNLGIINRAFQEINKPKTKKPNSSKK